jgi:peptidoglycan/xylan/chitin deacetylase (PgdA/CDA1 family)
MRHEAGFVALLRRLDRLAEDGRKVAFWLRDDDAVAPTAALDRLLSLTAAAAVPLTLAVIPAGTGAALARRLDEAAQATVALHGWAHRNHAGPGEKKQELGLHRPNAAILAELAAGRDRLAALHSDRFLPMLVPPWNRIAPEIAAEMPDIGFGVLSVFGPEDRQAPVKYLNTHVDIIDWRGSRGGRPEADLVSEMIGRIEAGPEPVGLLIHHLVHDEAAWTFLGRLFDLTADHPAVTWRGARDLISEIP